MKEANVLVIIDAQNDFVTGSLKNEDAQSRVSNIVDLIGIKNWDLIVTTQDTHHSNYLSTKEGYKLPIKHCIMNTKGWDICEEITEALDNSSSEKLELMKSTFGEEEIANLIYDNLECDYASLNIYLCGFYTDTSVITNALLLKTAFYEEASIKLVANACAGSTKEDHDSAIRVMNNCQIDILNYF